MRFLWAIWRIIRWPLLVIVVVLGGLFIYHLAKYPQLSRDTVAAIQSQKITEADVDGTNLPPAPDPAEADTTVEGVDANKNGIRDDVELAIFEEYPNDRKVRAAALQYAKAEQLFLTSVFNTETWKAAAQQAGRANICIAEVSEDYRSSESISKSIEEALLNSATRLRAYESAHSHTTSYSSKSDVACDI